MKTLTQQLKSYITACFSGIWVESFESDEAVREITALCKSENWHLVTWDIDAGLQPGTRTDITVTDPLSVVKSVSSIQQDNIPLIVVLKNFHRFVNSAEISQALENNLLLGKATRTFFVVISPVIQIPVELEKLFVVLEHPLPDREQLRQIACEITGETADATTLEPVLDAAAGMSRFEAEGAFALSIIEHDALVPDPLWKMKAQMLRHSSALRLYSGTVPTLGGLDAVTQFCTSLLRNNHGTEKPKGVMLLGVSGTGKSAFCKKLGQIANRPTLLLDIGALMGSLVGQTEAALRKALKQVDAMSPCIVMIDEVEKCISVTSGDSGVSARMFGTLLSWLNDRESDSFVVCTANDISRLPPEFTRAERFDGIFFVDLPDANTRKQIWKTYMHEYGISKQTLPTDTNWTGAEIKSCCRLSKLLDTTLQKAATNIIPVATTAAESISALRNWASKRCLNAGESGIYEAI
ncbi:MAG: AAA family ATPase [Thermoguttaceae bacterium]